MHADTQSCLSRYSWRYKGPWLYFSNIAVAAFMHEKILNYSSEDTFIILSMLFKIILNAFSDFFFFWKMLCLWGACISFMPMPVTYFHSFMLWIVLSCLLCFVLISVTYCLFYPFLSPSSRFLCGLNFKLFSLFYFFLLCGFSLMFSFHSTMMYCSFQNPSCCYVHLFSNSLH